MLHSDISEILARQVLLNTKEKSLEIKRNKKSYKIGIPCEITDEESRVPITPLAVKSLVEAGFEFYIESGAGKKANFSDIEYSECGAVVLSGEQAHTDVLKSDIIIRISPLSHEEIDLVSGNTFIITLLNFSDLEKTYIDKLISKKAVALACNMVVNGAGENEMTRSMSDIAGRSSILIASDFLSNSHGGKGELLGGIAGVSPTEVVVIGAGTAGISAARTALALGAAVKVFDYSVSKLYNLQKALGVNVYTSLIQPEILSRVLSTTDVVVGALRIEDFSSKKVITAEMVKNMKSKSIILDLSIDQGGISETSKITSHKNPFYEKFGVIHYCVPNIASRYARTSSYSISNLISSELVNMQNSGSLTSYIKENPGLRKGIYIYNGVLTNKSIAGMTGLLATDLDLLFCAV